MLENAKWIWKDSTAGKDEYVLFAFDIDYLGGSALIRLSADSDYNLFVNGELVSFGQYRDYEENTVYEEVSLDDALRPGKNRLEILVWHYGEANYNYSVAPAGLIFEVVSDGKQILVSDESILSAYEPHYKRGLCKNITTQLGFGYEYDAGAGEPIFSNSVEVKRAVPTLHRPVKKLILGEAVKGRLHSSFEGKKYVYDLGRETVGFLRFAVDLPDEGDLTVSFGEHLREGDVPRIIGYRDFSFKYRFKAGKNDFFNALRRLGCRYISLESDVPFDVLSLELLPTDYPVKPLPFDTGDPRRNEIYNTSVRTLLMCMHDHYEDCPWREQSLYTMDSRNQMLTGYYAFGEYDFPRASLALFANSRLCGGLLPICAPSDSPMTIPSFGLHYFAAVREYLEYSGDKDFVLSVYDRLTELISEYDKRAGDGLLPEFSGKSYWNFYEWRDGLSYEGKNKYHLVLNALYLKAQEEMARIARALGKPDRFSDKAERLKGEIYSYFYDESLGLFVLGKEEPLICELGNYLAILTGVVEGESARAIISRLRAYENRIPLTLSMRCFEYDALLLVDREGFCDEILKDIDKRWGKMLDEGATTFYETELGAEDFDGAGSLCHGWSAIPIYYYHLLLKK